MEMMRKKYGIDANIQWSISYKLLDEISDDELPKNKKSPRQSRGVF
jgi:hypothetical protein